MNITDTSYQPWIFDAPTEINQAIVNAIQDMMSTLYKVQDSDYPYLPWGWVATESTVKKTNYRYHDQSPTTVQWPGDDEKALYWHVDDSAVIDLKETAFQTRTPIAVTDCSGLITALLAQISTMQNQSISFDSFEPGKTIPFARDFFSYIQNSANGFAPVTLQELRPGDFIAFEYSSDGTSENNTDTGHIMVVRAVEEITEDNVSYRQVVVMDQSDEVHSNDTRYAPDGTTGSPSFTGLGMGIGQLVDNGATFCWSLKDKATREAPVVMGRLTG